MNEKLADWTEIKQMRGIWRIYALFLSPDEERTALVSLEDRSIIAIYDRAKKQMEYADPQLVKGVDLLHSLSNSSPIGDEFIPIGLTATRCAHCKVRYTSVEDFVERNPRRGEGSDLFVDSFCWDAYQANRKKGDYSKVA